MAEHLKERDLEHLVILIEAILDSSLGIGGTRTYNSLNMPPPSNRPATLRTLHFLGRRCLLGQGLLPRGTEDGRNILLGRGRHAELGIFHFFGLDEGRGNLLGLNIISHNHASVGHCDLGI